MFYCSRFKYIVCKISYESEPDIKDKINKLRNIRGMTHRSLRNQEETAQPDVGSLTMKWVSKQFHVG